MKANAGAVEPRTIAACACLLILLVSPLAQINSHMGMAGAFDGVTDPVTLKLERLENVFPSPPMKAAVGYVTDIEEPGYRTSENFFIARYVALPIVLQRFRKSQRWVVADMRGPEGVARFSRQMGYKIVRQGPPGAALLERNH